MDRPLSTRPRRREIWIRVVLLLGGCLAAIVMAEGVFRALEPTPDTEGVVLPGSLRGYGFKPNATGYAGGVQFWTDASGFRTCHPGQSARPAGKVIVVLGDSYAFGYGVRCQDAFPAVLARALEKRYPEDHFTVLNLGIPGYNTLQELVTFNEIAHHLHPDVVLLAYHLNDVERPIEGDGAGSRTATARIRKAKANFHVLRWVLPRLAALARSLGLRFPSTASAELAEYVAGGPRWAENKSTLRALFRAVRGSNSHLGVIVVPYVVDLTPSHPCIEAYDVVVDFCSSEGVTALSAFPYFLGMDARRLWINPLDGHPNAVGHGRIAEAALDVVVKGHLLQ